MNRMIKALAICSMLAFAGCAGDGAKFFEAIPKIATVATASIENPITRERLFEAENALTIAVAGLNRYKLLCLRGLADTHCRGNIERVQVYTRQLATALPSLRKFVKANDQVNAIATWKLFQELYAGYRSEAAAIPGLASNN